MLTNVLVFVCHKEYDGELNLKWEIGKIYIGELRQSSYIAFDEEGKPFEIAKLLNSNEYAYDTEYFLHIQHSIPKINE